MAKLINRYALFDAIRNITYNSKDADAFFEEVLEVITEQPTTTEAEIRAMALDEVIKAISNLLSGDTKHLEGGAYYKELAYLEVLHIAEQLKEE